MISFTEYKKKALKNKELREEYERLGPEYELIASIIEKRLKKKMTQTALARKIGTKQPSIVRLESGQMNPSIGFLQKVADGLDAKLKISIL